MNCLKSIRKLFRRGHSVPAIPTGNVDKVKKNELRKATSLKNFDAKKNAEVKTKKTTDESIMNKLNPEVIDSDDENNVSKPKSSIASQMKSNINNNDNISISKSKTEKTKSMLEYDTSDSSSIQTKNVYGEENKIKNASAEILIRSLSPSALEKASVKNHSTRLESENNMEWNQKTNKNDEELSRYSNYKQDVFNKSYSENPDYFYDILDNKQHETKRSKRNEDIEIDDQPRLIENSMDNVDSRTFLDVITQNNKDKFSDNVVKQLEIREEDTYKELLRNSASLQKADGDTLIKEQFRIIDSLKQRCQELENELKRRQGSEGQGSNNENIKALKDEIRKLREINRRLNSELSYYQLKNPSIANQVKNFDLNRSKSGLPTDGPIPSWIVNTTLLSPLIEAYDERLNSREEKNKQLRRKLDDLADKLKILVDENLDLQRKFEKIPIEYRNNISNQENKLSEWEQIKRHSQLVLEENITLHDQLDLQQQKFYEIQNNGNQEKARLSKRLLLLESEKNELLNQIDISKARIDELERKNSHLKAENEKRVGIEEHLKEINELKRLIDKMEFEHKNEKINILELLEKLQTEKTELGLRLNDAVLANKRHAAEIEVLDRTIQEGTGRKVQRKLTALQKQLELAEIKEKTAYICLARITKEMEKNNLEAESLKNLAKVHETEQLKVEKRVIEENMKISNLEQKLESIKTKASVKLAKTLERLHQKELDFTLLKLENEKQTSDILSLLEKKQDQIDKFLEEKKMIEDELNAVVASNEN